MLPDRSTSSPTAGRRTGARSRVFTEAAEGEALAWMRQLEEDEAVTPLWEVFFQLAAYPVPQVRCPRV